MIAITTCLLASSASGQCRYEVQLVPILGEGQGIAWLDPFGIGEDGTAAGRIIVGTNSQPGIWDRGDTIEFLPRPEGFVTGWVRDIYDLGSMAGFVQVQSGGSRIPAAWIDGIPILLEKPARILESEAMAINASGDIVGFSLGVNAQGVSHGRIPVIWHNGAYTEMESIFGTNSDAVDINDAGIIIGEARDPDLGFDVPVVWKDGKVTLLPVPPVAVQVDVSAINNRGIIVGGFRETSQSALRGIIWRNDRLSILRDPPTSITAAALDINDFGQIVGLAFTSLVPQAVGFLWQDGNVYSLTDLIVPTPEVTIIGRAQGINNRGEIAIQDGVVLVPIDPPVGDVDCNCLVGINDFLFVLSEWGRPGSFADTNADGEVDINDFMNVLVHWGEDNRAP